MRCLLLAGAVLFLASCGAGGNTASEPLGGFDSLRAAAGSISDGCAKTAGLGLPPLTVAFEPIASLAIWTPAPGRPLVYAASQYVTDRAGTHVAVAALSSRGVRMALPHDAQPVALWPCRRPVVFYYGNRGHLWMKALGATRGRRGSVSLGRVIAPATFDLQGRLVEFEGTTIHYLGGPTITPHGLPQSWRIQRLSPSPRQPSVFLAEVEKAGCTQAGDGRLYLITPTGNTRLATYDACGNPPLAGWSHDGSKIFWTTYRTRPTVTQIHVSDSSGSDSRRVATVKGQVLYALWSPDGSRIAYTIRGDLSQVADIDVATRAVRALTRIHWRPTRPPHQPPYATVVGWSPNAKTVLILHATANARRTTIEAVPAGGGRSRTLIRLKP